MKSKYSLLLGLLLLASCANSGKSKDVESYGLELTTLLYPFLNKEGVVQQLDNPDNILIPYVAERFGLKIKEILELPGDLTPDQAALLWASSKMLPDIVGVGAADFGPMVETNLFRPLDDLLNEMPHYKKVIPPQYWPREANPADGKSYGLYSPNDRWLNRNIAEDDVVTPGRDVRSLWVREDVLRALGYRFTPVSELIRDTINQSIRPTAEQLRLNPPIDTPEALMKLLRQIKNSGMTAPDGSPLIPFTVLSWEVWHLSVMYDNGYWRINRAGEVDGYLGMPGFKPYMRWLWTAYREGLIDPDFLVQKNVQIQEKIAAGRVAAGEFVPNEMVTFAQLLDNVPTADVHPVPIPKSSPDTGFFDVGIPFSYPRVLISKNVPDATVEKIGQLADWLLSEEGKSVTAWGPEESGLYQHDAASGYRRFRSSELEQGMLEGIQNGEGPYKYGLYDTALRMHTTPILFALMPYERTNLEVPRAYNYISNPLGLLRSVAGSDPRFSGISSHLEAANSDNSEEVSAVSKWFWNIFLQTHLPQLLKAGDEAEFEERYEWILNAFMQETNYPIAKQRMVEYFQKFPPEW